MSEWFKVRAFLAILVLFLASAYFSYKELRFLAFAKTTDAAIANIWDVPKRGRYGSETHLLRVEYTFTEPNGTKRTERDEVPMSWSSAVESETIPVEYIPGDVQVSRLVGHSQRFWLAIFAVFGAVAAFGVFKFWRFYKS